MFTWAFETLIMSALLAALVTFACRFTRLSPALCHLLWLVIMLRMIAPPVMTWPYSLEDIWGSGFGWRHETAALPAPAETTGAPAASAVVLKARGASPAAAPIVAAPVPNVFNRDRTFVALGGTWLLGSITLFLVQGLRLRRFFLLIARGYPAPEWIAGMSKSMAAQFGLRPPRIVVVPGIASPMAWGTFRKTILLPESAVQTLGPDRWPGILAHELAHLKRRDDWAGWIELIAGCLQWWNPVFWYAARRLHEYSELACDAWVVWALPDRRREYADTLVCAAELAASLSQPAPVMGMGHGPAVAFERRLLFIVCGQVTHRLSRLGIAGVLAFAALTIPSWPQNTPAAPGESAAAPPKQAAEPPQSPLAPGKSFAEKLSRPVSMEFENIHVNEICQFIADSYEINSVLDWRVIPPPPSQNAEKTPPNPPGAREFVTDGIVRYFNMKDVPVKEAFHALTRGLNLACVFEANAVWITSNAMIEADNQRDLPEPSPLEQSLRASLARNVSMEFENIHMSDVMEFAADSYDLNIVVDQRVVQPKEGASSPENAAQYVTDGLIPALYLKDIPLVEALDLLVRPLNLTVLPRGNMLWVTSHAHSFEPLGTAQPISPAVRIRPIEFFLGAHGGFAARLEINGEIVEAEEGGLVAGYKVEYISLDDLTIQLRRQSDGSVRTFAIPVPFKEFVAPAPGDIVALKTVQLPNGLLLAHLRLGTIMDWLRQGERRGGWLFDGAAPERGEIRLVRDQDKYAIHPASPEGIVQIPWSDPPAGVRLVDIQLANDGPRALMDINGHRSHWIEIGARVEQFICLDIVPGARVITVFDESKEAAVVLQQNPESPAAR